MPITIVNWIMTLNLVVTFILMNIFENKKIDKSVRRLEVDRRYFSYDAYLPERRLEIDRRHFSYDAYIPERRVGGDQRLSYN